ncbi:MAG: Trm112 family protein [Rhizobiales bacterium]|nr:Trm112 family protein [Hyphomicrobiales bacterium]
MSDDTAAPASPADQRTAVPPTRPGTVDPRLLEVLVCPVTKATLDYDAEANELISRAARLAYPIRDGIPIMLPEEARPLAD